MPARLLIINPASPFFFYIPMGTFGLCDYLETHGIASRIFNHALYDAQTADVSLAQTLLDFEPTHIAVIFHWQETAHGVQHVLEHIHQHAPQLPIIIGGFSAGYFGKDILRHFSTVDYLIQGDPEEPLLHLLQEKTIGNIANLTFRNQDAITTSSHEWLIDQQLLNTMSFARIDLLEDANQYFTKINAILGFPLFIGRGCVFNCDYCGGSRQAFTIHSHRNHPVCRSIPSIIKDLHHLKEVTDTLYICYENNPQYIISLFRAIAADQELRNHFTLNYGAWHLVDDDFLAAYKNAFNRQGAKPVFEFSPEVIADKSRKKIKGAATYALGDLIDNCIKLSKELQHNTRIELFFSRYHPTEATKELLDREIEQIFSLKHTLYTSGHHSIHVCYDHLSTDVASGYWHQQPEHSNIFCDFLVQKQLIDQQQRYPFPVDNLCLYMPPSLSEKELMHTEALIQCLEHIEQNYHELFHILFYCTGTFWLRALATIIEPWVEKQQAAFFAQLPLAALLDELVKIIRNEKKYERLSFFNDLVAYSLKKEELRFSGSELAEYSESDDILCTLNRQRMSIHQYDYSDLSSFLDLLQQMEGNTAIPYQRTVCFFLQDEVLSLPHRSYRLTLRQFEQCLKPSVYLETLHKTVQVDVAAHTQIIERFREAGVLVPCYDNIE